LEAGSHDLSHFLARCWQHRAERGLAVVAEAVGAIGRQRVRVGQNVLRAANPFQTRCQLGGGTHHLGVSRITVIASLRRRTPYEHARLVPWP
jgi:hypothetical protein